MNDLGPLPDTIDPSDERYNRLGAELSETLNRTDGADVAKSLHAHFEQDRLDWFCEGICGYFSHLSEDDWPQAAAIEAGNACRKVVTFFQSIRGVATAIQRGYVPTAKAEWYTKWLMQLIIGADQITDTTLASFQQRDREGSMGLWLRAAIGRWLPEIQGKDFWLELYAPALDLRVEATTTRAFRDTSEAQELYSRAMTLEKGLRIEAKKYFTGGCVVFLLESDRGMLLTRLPRYGQLFHLWSEEDYAHEINEAEWGKALRVLPMNYRELEELLQQLRLEGHQNIAIDRRLNGDAHIAPIDEILQHVQRTINNVETSELGKIFKDGFSK